MDQLKNWDNKTWLSSMQYISSFKNFLKSNTEISKNSKVLDIGCGRANIISYLHKQYKFKSKPIGVDIIKNRGVKKNIIFKKILNKKSQDNNISFIILEIKKINFLKLLKMIFILN